MRSIRLSLILYFLILLSLALGAVSALVYQSVQETLQEKNLSAQHSLREKRLAAEQGLKEKRTSFVELHETRFQERRREANARLDEALLADAKGLASMAQVKTQFADPRVLALGALTASQAPQGHLFMVSYLGPAFPPPPWTWQRNSAFWHVYLASKQLKLRELHLPPDHAPQVADFLQINTSADQWTSPMMGEASFRFNPKIFDVKDARKVVDWKYDDTELDDFGPVRRVQLKVSSLPVLPVMSPLGSGAPRGPSRPSGKGGDAKKGDPKKSEPKFGEPPPAEPKPGEPPAGGSPGTGQPAQPKPMGPPAPSLPPPAELAIYIQAAATTHARDASIAQFAQERDAELARLDLQSAADLAQLERDSAASLAQLERDSAASLAALEQRLWWVGLATFLAVLVGGCAVVGLGLRPLRRLGEAVSQVSEKDFHLSLQGRALPSELRPIASRLQETLEQLKRAFAREKQAAADISHELRTPVAAILTMLDVGLRKQRSAEEYREMLVDVRETGKQMHQLVERMLALARLDAGADHLRPSEVDAARLADQCAAMVRPLAEARGLELEVSRDGPTTLRADPDKLREIINNLLHNAIEYNKPNGRIDLAVRRDNGHVQVEVKDTGIGIAPEAKTHIFERFYRADPSRTADSTHAGIGLAIVKGYVELMGGAIAVESQPGEGSAFTVTLPAKEEG